MLVVDASVLAPVLADAGVDGQRFRNRLRGDTILGPDLLRIEVTSVLRRLASTAQLTSEQAEAAISDLLDFPVKVFPTSLLLPRVWELRLTLSVFDSCYVALAEAVDAVLLTADHRLPRAPGPRCNIEAL